MPDQNHTLNLDDITASAPRIQIGSDSYPLLLPKHLGLQKTAVAQKLGSRFVTFGNRMTQVIDNKEMVEEEKEAAVDEIVEGMQVTIGEFLDVVMPSMPESTRAGLDDVQQMAILDFFTVQAAQSVAYQKEILAATSRVSPSTTESATPSS